MARREPERRRETGKRDFGGLSGHGKGEVENERSQKSSKFNILSRGHVACGKSTLNVQRSTATSFTLLSFPLFCLGQPTFKLQPPDSRPFGPHRQDPTDDIRNELARTSLLASLFFSSISTPSSPRIRIRHADVRRDVQKIFRAHTHHKQVMMFSATLAKDIRVTCKSSWLMYVVFRAAGSSLLTSSTVARYFCR